MDPESTLCELEDCIDDNDFPGAVQRLAAYYQWRLSGGFEPIEGSRRGDMVAERLAAKLADKLETAVIPA